MMTQPLFIGIDVQDKRGCSYFVINQQRSCVDSGWAKGKNHNEILRQLIEVVRRYKSQGNQDIHIGIDSPRMPLPSQRLHYWNGKRNKWRKQRPSEKGYGRHCEVVVKAINIANPQWTRTLKESPPWMKLGFMIYEALQNVTTVYEVFPSASYHILQENRKICVSINFAEFVQGPKDMLDACIAAVTVLEYVKGNGTEIGGGDGLGTIILPNSLPQKHATSNVLIWPGKQ